MTRKPVKPAVALERLEALCNASEQCSADLRRKLDSWGVPARAREAIMERLAGARLVDDARFCAAYARDKMRYSGWGRFRIRAALAAKRLDRDYIDDAVDALDPDEYRQAAVRVLAAAAARLDAPQSYESRVKILRRGVARGFESALVMSIVNSGELWLEED